MIPIKGLQYVSMKPEDEEEEENDPPDNPGSRRYY